jgi:hypothetical protein
MRSRRGPAISALFFALLGGCSEPEIVALECGDLRVDAPEVCDEGDQNGLPGHCSADCSTEPAIVAVEGDVLAFLTEVEGPRIAGATVSILEHPEMRVTTGADAHFRFEGLLEGTDVTLLVEHPDIKTTQTATVTLGPQGIPAFSIQVVPVTIFNALSALVPMPVEEDKYCVIASTVARMGGSLYVRLRQGAPDVQVSLEPAVPAESGPIYFDEDVLPAIGQGATSIDGGVLFYRVPPGDYVMSASRAGQRPQSSLWRRPSAPGRRLQRIDRRLVRGDRQLRQPSSRDHQLPGCHARVVQGDVRGHVGVRRCDLRHRRSDAKRRPRALHVPSSVVRHHPRRR